jgi:hypothetical protein
MLLVSLLIAAATLHTVLNTGHVIAGYWYVVVPILFSAIALLIPLGQWLFPIPAETATPVEVNVSLTPPLAEPAAQNVQTKQLIPIWNIPYQRNRFFTGREELLKHLHDNLTNRKAAALSQAISGLGGIGKTQTAVEYAYH